MSNICFAWDPEKATLNKHKHNIAFPEAKSVFFDPNALLLSDPDHSEAEERFIIIGLSQVLRVLVVCHCYRKQDSVIRIISARKANKREQTQYQNRSKT